MPELKFFKKAGMTLRVFRISILYFIFLCPILCYPKESKIKVVFRYDDFTLTNNYMDSAVLHHFENHHIPLCIGIIPFDSAGRLLCSLDNEDIFTLRKLVETGELEIAMHGYSHTKNSSCGEFSGLSFKDQLFMISRGKKVLDSIFNTHENIITFIPPYNGYDQRTLSALEISNFKIISSALEGCQQGNSAKLGFMPFTIGSPALVAESIGNAPMENVLIIVMFHQYDFKETVNKGNYGLKQQKISFKSLDALLDKVNSNKTIECTTFSKLLNEREDLSYTRMQLNRESFLVKNLLMIRDSYYLTAATITRFKLYNCILYILAFAFALVFSIVILSYIKGTTFNFIVFILISFLFVCVFFLDHTRPKMTILLTILGAFLISAFGWSIKSSKN